MKKCKDCDHFKIIQDPKSLGEWGTVICTKYNVIADFFEPIKLEQLHCVEKSDGND